MTESEWLTCTNAPDMVAVAVPSPRATQRTCRLCAVAFWRWQATRLSPDERTELLARVDALEACAETGVLPLPNRYSRSRDTVFFSVDAVATLRITTTAPNDGWGTDWRAAVAMLPLLLRDIFGNPFRPVAFDPAWRTDTAVALARQMYDTRELGAMPILADALQDAGCENEDVLTHCRAAGPHARGCWVVDGVLGLE